MKSVYVIVHINRKETKVVLNNSSLLSKKRSNGLVLPM